MIYYRDLSKQVLQISRGWRRVGYILQNFRTWQKTKEGSVNLLVSVYLLLLLLFVCF